MARETNGREERTKGSPTEWPRRTVLRVSGAAAGLTALGGGTVVGAGQESGTETETGNETSGGGDDAVDGEATHFVGDLIDPVFGYPLAVAETDDVDVEYVVEAYTDTGPGVHDNFPVVPDQAGGEASAGAVEFPFDPVGLHVTTDDLVQFHSTVGEHTVTAIHEKFSIPQRELSTRVPGGVPGFTSPPIVDGESWIYRFPEPGVYDLFCLPHLSFGMVMRVVVSEPDAEGTESEGYAPPAGGELPPNALLVLTAPELEPDAIVDQGSVAWADLTLDVPDAGGGNETDTGNETTTDVGGGNETDSGNETATE